MVLWVRLWYLELQNPPTYENSKLFVASRLVDQKVMGFWIMTAGVPMVFHESNAANGIPFGTGKPETVSLWCLWPENLVEIHLPIILAEKSAESSYMTMSTATCSTGLPMFVAVPNPLLSILHFDRYK